MVTYVKLKEVCINLMKQIYFNMEDLPTYEQYKSSVDNLVSRNELTMEQAIILLTCYNATLNESLVHINFLMQKTGLAWKQINWTLNGLVQRNAIQRVEDKYYCV